MSDILPRSVVVAAPPSYVWNLLTSFRQGSPLWEPDLKPEVVDASDRVLTIRRLWRTPLGKVRALERVRLYPIERMVFEHLEGITENLREEVVLQPLGGATRIEYSGDMTAGSILARTLGARWRNREMRRALDRWRVVVEAAARASGWYVAPPADDAPHSPEH